MGGNFQPLVLIVFDTMSDINNNSTGSVKRKLQDMLTSDVGIAKTRGKRTPKPVQRFEDQEWESDVTDSDEDNGVVLTVKQEEKLEKQRRELKKKDKDARKQRGEVVSSDTSSDEEDSFVVGPDVDDPELIPDDLEEPEAEETSSSFSDPDESDNEALLKELDDDDDDKDAGNSENE